MSEQFNGTVRVKDGNKAPMDYGVNREVEVSISFFTDDQKALESMANHAADVADRIVHNKLQPVVAIAGAAAVVETGKPGRKTKDKLPTPAAANDNKADPAAITVEAVKAKPTEATSSDGKADPASMGGGEAQAIQTGGERVDPGAVDESLFTSAPPAITDNDLMATITRKNAETKNSAAIRAMIGRYVPQDGKPHQAVEIPQENRAAFKLELDTVQKLAA